MKEAKNMGNGRWSRYHNSLRSGRGVMGSRLSISHSQSGDNGSISPARMACERGMGSFQTYQILHWEVEWIPKGAFFHFEGLFFRSSGPV
jgi:hypothetical protein